MFLFFSFFFFNDTATTEIYTLSLHDALPISLGYFFGGYIGNAKAFRLTSSSGGLGTYVFQKILDKGIVDHLFIVQAYEGAYNYEWFEKGSDILRSEEHTSELQSRPHLVCRLLLEKKKKKKKKNK